MNTDRQILSRPDSVPFRIRAYGKTELARKYMIRKVSDRTARRFLDDCIRKNKELERRLHESGYHTRNYRLTPLQVRIIIEYIGEP